MATPHNNAEKKDIAKTVIMPGDPLRAKFIAENWLETPVLFNEVRNMYGYTGIYKGKWHPAWECLPWESIPMNYTGFMTWIKLSG